LCRPRLIDGTNVVFEVPVKPRGGQGSSIRGGEESPRPCPDQPQAGHHDWVSEIAMCQASQCFLLSGSRDGVIKVWK
jgi:WD40 repeat protein